MRGYSVMSDEERQSILSQHKTLYNGYAVGNIPNNLTPLTVANYATDEGGITVNSNGEVSSYTNHNINESKELDEEYADDMDLSDIDPAYDFESGGPEEFNSDTTEMDGYEMDLESIQNMFDFEDIYGSDNDAEGMMGLNDMLDDEFDGKEKMKGEKSAFNFKSDGSGADVFGESDKDELEEGEMCEQCGMKEGMCECGMYEEVDEDIRESLKDEKNKITEMFNRFKNYN